MDEKFPLRPFTKRLELLTYMSIQDEIRDRCSRKMLYALEPRAFGAPIRRALFLAEPLWKLLNSPEGDDEWEERIGLLQADLEMFVTEELIGPKYLRPLLPARDGVWAIRSDQDKPTLRVLCLFAGKDQLIATGISRREDLGVLHSKEWKIAKRAARASWRNLFQTYEPVIATSIVDVCTGVVDGVFYEDRLKK